MLSHLNVDVAEMGIAILVNIEIVDTHGPRPLRFRVCDGLQKTALGKAGLSDRPKSRVISGDAAT